MPNSIIFIKKTPTKLSLGFSPCPNDCFIFDALVNKKIDTEGLSFEVIIADVETLNKNAFNNLTDITKLSFHAFMYLTKNYLLLDSGSALGNNCGPLLISKTNQPLHNFNNPEIKIAIPGQYTTANFLLNLALPKATNKVAMPFSEIENAVLTNQVDAGLLIHENRFTYQQKGLKKIIDLGTYWENLSKAPIPLGGIVIKRNFSIELQQKVNRIIQNSLLFALKNPLASIDFIQNNAQTMHKEVIAQHIALYVNDYSINLGRDGRNAITLLFKKAIEHNIIPTIHYNLFSPTENK